MTEQQLKDEFRYRYEERLGILCCDKEPTTEQMALAMEEADAAIQQLKTSQ